MKNKNNRKPISVNHKNYLKKKRKESSIIWILRLGVLIVFFLIWELSAKLNLIDPFITSSPSRIVDTLIGLIKAKTLWEHIFVTLYETMIAFTISMVIGSLMAILLYMFIPARKVLEPYLVILNSLPKVALGPLIIVWVGAGPSAIITMGVLICVIVTTISLLASFISINEDKILLLKTMGASKNQILTKLVLPESLPSFISVLKINVGLSWVGTIMGEYLVSSAGLGYLILYGGQVFNLNLVMASIVVLCVLAALMYFSVAWLEHYINKKRS